MPAKPGSNHPRPPDGLPEFGQPMIHVRPDRPHVEAPNCPRGHAARDARRLSHSPGVRCQAAGALAWLERHTALCSANPRECQPTPPIRQGPPLLPVFLVMQSPASLCAGEGGSVPAAVKSLYSQGGPPRPPRARHGHRPCPTQWPAQ